MKIVSTGTSFSLYNFITFFANSDDLLDQPSLSFSIQLESVGLPSEKRIALVMDSFVINFSRTVYIGVPPVARKPFTYRLTRSKSQTRDLELAFKGYTAILVSFISQFAVN